jgi:uncharacterized membrane protein
MTEPTPSGVTAEVERFYHLLDPRRAALRVAFAALVGVVSAALFAHRQDWVFRFVLGWDVGALTLLCLVWGLILTADPHETRCRAASADPGRTATWIIVLIASSLSFFTGAVVLRHLSSQTASRQLSSQTASETELLVLCLLSVLLAWTVTHTSYTLRYAHLYYRDDGEGEGGLTFPGDAKPSDWDFAYFSYTVGMCFQVSDVAVTSPAIRRAVLGHAVLSFLYNTVILALALNLFFGFVSKS